MLAQDRPARECAVRRSCPHRDQPRRRGRRIRHSRAVQVAFRHQRPQMPANNIVVSAGPRAAMRTAC